MIFTLIATLMMPVQYAVFLGVVLSVMGYLASSAHDVRLVEDGALIGRQVSGKTGAGTATQQ